MCYIGYFVDKSSEFIKTDLSYAYLTVIDSVQHLITGKIKAKDISKFVLDDEKVIPDNIQYDLNKGGKAYDVRF